MVDGNNNRIQVFTAEGEFLRMFGNVGRAEERLCGPYSVAVESSGMVYVSQPKQHCISVYTCEGQFLTSFSTVLENEVKRDTGPFGLAMDSQGLVYVCDPLSYKVKIF